ncbi:hypothetical protein AB0G05_20035 [Nonomuraea wenchangensis]
MVENLHVDPGAIVTALLKRISDLTYENAVLAVAVDQLQAQLKQREEAAHAGHHPG